MKAKRRKPQKSHTRRARVVTTRVESKQLEMIRNVLDGKLIEWTEVKPWPCIAPLPVAPVARALGVIPERLLAELLQLDALDGLDAEELRVDPAEACRVRAGHEAEAKRWRDVETHMRSAIDLIGTAGWRGPGSRWEGPGDTQLRELPWPSLGEVYPPELRELGEQIGHEVPGRRIMADHIPVTNVLGMIADQVAERATRAEKAADHIRDLEKMSSTKKLRADLSCMRAVHLDKLLRAAGWTRLEIADLILADKYWEREWRVAVKIAPAHTRESLKKWIEDQVQIAKKAL